MAVNSISDIRNWPPVNFDYLEEEDHRAVNNLIADKIEHAPSESEYASRQNLAMVVNNAGNGITTADQATHVDFASRAVREFKPHILSYSTSQTLTDNLHGGGVIVFASASALTFTVSISSNPATGVSSPFRCEVRNHGSGTLSLVLGGGVTNRNPVAHTKVQVNRGATLLLIGTELWFDGYTLA
jgi:hypothetical protein